MKKSNKKRIASLVLCGAFLAGFVLVPADASAEKKTITGTGKTQTTSATVDGESGKLDDVEIPIKAGTKGADIVYNIDVEYGAMTFTYTYGRTWNANTHSYSGGTVGWDPSELTSDNNKITVTNNSNYPVKASFAVKDPTELAKKFNSDYTSTNAVKGYFSQTLTDFVTGGAVTNLIKTGTNPSKQTASMTLEMDASTLTTGDVYYRKVSSVVKTDTAAAKGDMFFALAGVPDLNISDPTEVGSIAVTIAPESDTTKVTVP